MNTDAMNSEHAVSTTELAVEGMSCAHCQSAVRNALQRVTGVVDAQVDLSAGRATVKGTADAAALIAAVVDEGYRASPVGS